MVHISCFKMYGYYSNMELTFVNIFFILDIF